MRSLPPEDRKGNSGNPPAITPKVVNVKWETPRCPDTVKDSELWASIWELGGPTGVFHAVADYNLIRRYCELIQRRDDMTETLGGEWTDVGSTGQTIMHPLARIIDSVESKLIAIEDRLGLNPQARHTIQIGGAQAAAAGSQLAAWLEDKQ